MHMNQKSEAVRNLVWFLARVDTGEPGPESHYLGSPDKALSLSVLMCSRGCWLWGLCQASVPLTTVSSSPVCAVSYSSRSTLCLLTQTITFCFFPPRSPHLFCSFYLSMWMSGLLLSIWICSTCMPGALRSHWSNAWNLGTFMWFRERNSEPLQVWQVSLISGPITLALVCLVLRQDLM